MNGLVLSLFPGIGLLDMAFEQEGFCIVRGPDVLWGGDIRRFHPPTGTFDGVIGGPPCQCFSRLARMVRHNGYEPKFGNLIPEFERVVTEAAPRWFVMENVPEAPVPSNVSRDGAELYRIETFVLNNRHCYAEDGQPAIQHRLRRWSWGYRGAHNPLCLDLAALENIDFAYAATGGSSRPIALGGSGKPKRYRDGKGSMSRNAKSAAAFSEIRRKQGLPDDYELPGFTVEAKCKALGNGVPLPMGRAIAQAVRGALAAAAAREEESPKKETARCPFSEAAANETGHA